MAAFRERRLQRDQHDAGAGLGALTMRNPFFRRASGRPFETAPQAEVDDELAFHLEQRIRDYTNRGMDPAAARAAALERFGDLRGVRDECTQLLEADRRAVSRRDWFADLAQDMRYGVRAALRARTFSLLTIVTLALGIGANAAVFGVVKSVLLDALPYADADRLVRAYASKKDGTFPRMSLSAGMVRDWSTRSRSFARVGVFYPITTQAALIGHDGPLPLTTAFADGGFFGTLGVTPYLGRTLDSTDVAPGAPRVAVVSYDAWQRLLGGERAAVGRPVRLNSNEFTVVGVLPKSFVGPMGAVDFWTPLDITPAFRDPVRVRNRTFLGLVARLRPGVSHESASRELSTIGAELGREFPGADGVFNPTLVPLRDDLVGDVRMPLLVLMASASLVLLITCANLAGALLSRTIARRQEFAVRVALGASRGRLVRQLLTESALLSLVGGAAGIALATASLALLRQLALPALPPYATLALDPSAIAIAFALSLCTGLAFGLAPALSVGRTAPQGALREETRGATGGRRATRFRGTLVAGQIALCVSLLAGAGLLTRSLLSLMNAPLGYSPDGVFTAKLQLPASRYPNAEARDAFMRQFEARLRTIPGVTRAAFTSALPGEVQSRDGFTIDGAPPIAEADKPFALVATVSPDYFAAVGVPLMQGRTFANTDIATSPGVVVISKAMAERYWPKGNAVGSRIRTGPDPNSPFKEIVGVVGDVRNDPAALSPEAMMYTSSRQEPWTDILLVRTSADPATYSRQVQGELTAIDPALPLYDASSLRAHLDRSLVGRRMPVMLIGAFGALALLLASVGVYAMFSSMASAREREFGVRVALGSGRRSIAALVLRQGASWMALGLGVGALGVYFMARVLRSMLYGIAPFDPIALGIAVLLLVMCAIVAVLGPVRRATRVDPITVLR